MQKQNNLSLPPYGKKIVPPIIYEHVNRVWTFYTSQGKLIQSLSREEAYAKWLLTKEDN